MTEPITIVHCLDDGPPDTDHPCCPITPDELADHRQGQCDDGCRVCYREGKAPWRRPGRDDVHDYD
jgi:hypothetical protein